MEQVLVTVLDGRAAEWAGLIVGGRDSPQEHAIVGQGVSPHVVWLGQSCSTDHARVEINLIRVWVHEVWSNHFLVRLHARIGNRGRPNILPLGSSVAVFVPAAAALSCSLSRAGFGF